MLSVDALSGGCSSIVCHMASSKLVLLEKSKLLYSVYSLQPTEHSLQAYPMGSIQYALQ